jgi:hypothetical protein
MFQFNDPQLQLDQFHQRSAEWRREAAAYRLARQASSGDRHRSAWWSRSARRPSPVRAPAAS